MTRIRRAISTALSAHAPGVSGREIAVRIGAGDIIRGLRLQCGESAINPDKFSNRQTRCVLTGLGCAAVVFCWQLLTVHYNYGGNWTGLFCTGAHFTLPAQLAAEHIYQFANSNGYDGQFYHYLAHDPFFQRGLLPYVQAPRYRARRILIPLTAYLVAFGRDDWIDAAYVAVILLVVFCGAWWLSLYAMAHGFHPAWGLLFVAVPGTVTSIDRMTIDGGLAALCIGFALYAEEGAGWRTCSVLVAAALMRETGLILTGGYVLYLLWKRSLRTAVLFATTAVPALIWFAYVWVHTRAESNELMAVVPTRDTWFSLIPMKAFVARMAQPYHYQTTPGIDGALIVFDYVALLFVALVIAVALRMAWRREAGPVEYCIYLYALMAIFLSFQDAWTEVYGFGRILSPLLVLAGLYGIERRKWIAAAPVLVVGARALLQLAPQSLKILEGVF